MCSLPLMLFLTQTSLPVAGCEFTRSPRSTPCSSGTRSANTTSRCPEFVFFSAHPQERISFLLIHSSAKLRFIKKLDRAFLAFYVNLGIARLAIAGDLKIKVPGTPSPARSTGPSSCRWPRRTRSLSGTGCGQSGFKIIQSSEV